MANPTADFPTTLHTATDVSAFVSQKLGSTTPTHTNLEGKQETEIVAIQTKIGTGSSTPTSGTLLAGTGTGTSAWQTDTSIKSTIVDAKGDLIVATGADAVSRLAVGANTYVLTADDTQATGVKWAAAASGGGFNVGLFPGSFNLVGATNEPDLIGVTGTNRNWTELQFTDSSTDLMAQFNLPSRYTNGYKGGTVYVKIDFYHTQATVTSPNTPSFRFACGLKSLVAGTAPDTAAPTSSTGYATGDYEVPDNADTSELRSILITLTSPSLTAGDNWIGYIKRLSNGVDYATGIAKVVGVTIYE